MRRRGQQDDQPATRYSALGLGGGGAQRVNKPAAQYSVPGLGGAMACPVVRPAGLERSALCRAACGSGGSRTTSQPLGCSTDCRACETGRTDDPPVPASAQARRQVPTGLLVYPPCTVTTQGSPSKRKHNRVCVDLIPASNGEINDLYVDPYTWSCWVQEDPLVFSGASSHSFIQMQKAFQSSQSL
ncbi:hypothetical protein MJG53_019049 [Ovis ammon polii x Ovis aries]|uniref:Uncharacterized protein n=1 Tax=Ovis ammon polii x Ovis aries TaxID=2918886 RepID=A0ACB9U3D1_9CETA|nr:hypothetical protein MJG53_019049 [Ovis ammon polii x Ovis aries]